MSKPNTNLVPRQRQRKGWFSVDNDLFRGGWAAEIGAYGVAVYSAIAMHADSKTQKATPSIPTLQRLSGISEGRVRKATVELAAWNIIHVRPRMTSRRCTSNEYTLLDKSVWLTEAQIPNGKDEVTGEPTYVTKRVKAAAAQEESDDAVEGVAQEQDTDIGGSLDEPETVHQMDGGSSSGEPGVAQMAQGDGSSGAPKQYPKKKTHFKETKEQHQDGQDGVVEPFGSLSSLTEVLSKRQLSVQEEHQFQQHLVLYLMKCVAPDFHAVDGYVRKLTREKTRRAGAALMFIYGNSVKAGTINNPAGLLRKKIECAEEEFPGLDGLLITWLQLVEHVKVAASQGGRDSQLSNWLVAYNLNDSLLAALKSYGITMEWDYGNAPWN